MDVFQFLRQGISIIKHGFHSKHTVELSIMNGVWESGRTEVAGTNLHLLILGQKCSVYRTFLGSAVSEVTRSSVPERQHAANCNLLGYNVM